MDPIIPEPPKSELGVQRKYASTPQRESELGTQRKYEQPTPDELMHDFAKETVRERAQARAFSNTHTPIKGKVEDVRSSTSSSSKLSRKEKSGANNRNDKRSRVFHKPFSFALEYDTSGARIWFGTLTVAINQTALTLDIPGQPTPAEGATLYPSVQIHVEQQEIPQPVVYNPVNFDGEDRMLPYKLGWFGNVFLQWECDENAVMDPLSVEIVGPATPSSVPIPLYSTGTPPPVTTCRYFVKLGSVDEGTGEVIQDWASDYAWQINLIRGGGTGT